MDYSWVVDTLRGFWPGGQEVPACMVVLNLTLTYRGGRRTVAAYERAQSIRIPGGVYAGARVYLPCLSATRTHEVDFCSIIVDDQPPFKRCGDNLHLERTIDAFTAILGGEVVPTLFGQTTLDVPASTAPGTTLYRPGLGMPVLGRPEEHRDLCVHLKVVTPDGFTNLERRLIDDNVVLRGWGLHAS